MPPYSVGFLTYFIIHQVKIVSQTNKCFVVEKNKMQNDNSGISVK